MATLKQTTTKIDKLRVGVIGLGGAGRAQVRRFNRNPHVAKVYGYDIKKISGLENVTITKTVKELFDNVDAITICTPDQSHFDYIIAGLKAGKHVLTEKPMTASLAQAKRLRPFIARYPKLVFGVHHQMRTIPAFKKAKELIAEGKLGKLFYIEANYWHDMRERASKFDNWRDKQGQSLIFAHGCHPLDLIMDLVGKAPLKHSTFLSKNSFAEYNAAYTSATSMLQFEDNVIAKSHINSFCIYPQLNDIVVLGDKGTYIDGILYTDKEGFKQVADFFGKSGWFNTEMNINKVGVPRKLLSFLINAYMRTSNKLSLLLMHNADFGFRRYPLSVYNHDYACQLMIDNFIAAIQGKEKIIANLEDATRVIALCEALEAEGLGKMKRK